MSNNSNNKIYSLRRRVLWTLVPFLIIFFMLLAYALERSYAQALRVYLEEQMTLQMRILLADSEVTENGNVLPTTVQEPRLKKPDSDLFAFVVDKHGNLLWQSPSLEYANDNKFILSVNVREKLLNLKLGESTQFRAAQDSFATARMVAFALDNLPVDQLEKTALSKPLIFAVVDSGHNFMMQLGEFRRTLGLLLFLVLLVLLCVQLILLLWLFKPLRILSNELGQVEAGEKTKFENDYPAEIKPLTDSLNQFVVTERQQRERYRNTLADLAHSLKTPLAALRASLQTEVDSGVCNKPVMEQIERMDQIVAYQLNRSKIAPANQLTTKQCDSAAVIRRLLSALEKVYAEKQIRIVNQIPQSFTVPMAEDDLFETLGNILDNAFKFCDGKISIAVGNTVFNGESSCLISIEDNGPGIGQEAMDQVTGRGVRLDEASEGQGIGLSVAMEIIDAYGGSLQFGLSSMGGVLVEIFLPKNR